MHPERRSFFANRSNYPKDREDKNDHTALCPSRRCHRLEDYISLTEKALAAFHEKRIYNLEGIKDKGRSVLESIKGIGPARQKAILEIMNDVLNNDK